MDLINTLTHKTVTNKTIAVTLSSAVILLLGGCTSAPHSSTQTATHSAAQKSQLNLAVSQFQQGAELPYTVIDNTLPNGANPTQTLEIRNGGYGSDAVAHPTNPNQFYALTDRGPNAKFSGSQGKGKKFPTPSYAPRIGLFELQADGSIIKIKDIILKNTNGQPITGLPNKANFGGTGETPYDMNGNPILVNPALPYNAQTNPTFTDDFGLDGEGLVALKDGTFWVSDEYGPHIVHFDATGKEIERINAFANDPRNNVIINGKVVLLPAEFANRRANRGMEGLAITPDETTLVGIMQSTMDNPNKDVRNQDLTRIVTVNLKTGAIAQYLYQQQKAQNSNSGIVALDNSHFLVIERDGGFGLKKAGVQKQIYKISIDNATNLEAIGDSTYVKQAADTGLTINGNTLEQLIMASGGNWDTLTKLGINPVSKTLVLDAVEAFNYPHDKLEGMWLMGDGRLGLLNDDDFATWSTDGVLEQKYLDKDQTNIDSNRLYIATEVDY